MTIDMRAIASNWDRAFGSGELSELKKLYAESAIVVPAGGETVEGRDAIEAFFASVRASGLTEHKIAAPSLVERGETAIASGTWLLTGKNADGEAVKLGGNWINVLGRNANGWEILLHTWN